MNSNKKDGGSAFLWDNIGSNLLRIQPFLDSIIVDAEGCYLVDADGRRILDMAAGQFCGILGYKHSSFIERLQKQVSRIIHIPNQYVSYEVLDAARRLAEICPGSLNQVLFLSTGSEANECVLRIAKVITGKIGTLAINRGYHGISLATRNLSSISDYPWKIDYQPSAHGAHKLIAPTCNSCPLKMTFPDCKAECLDLSLNLIGSRTAEIGMVIIETVISAGGMIFPPKLYIQKLYNLSKEIGALFVIDEAQTGFGRCGKWFDFENYEIEPDILVVSKTAGNGYPVSAVVVSDEVRNLLETSGFTHLSSHQNDPLAAAAVHAVIDIVEQDDLINQARKKGEYFLEKLLKLQEQHACIKDVRGRGLMLGMELDWQSFPQKTGAFYLAMLCQKYGLHVTFSYYEQVVRFIPPLTVTMEDIDFAVEALHKSINDMKKETIDIKNLLPQNPRNAEFIKILNGNRSFKKIIKKIYNTSPKYWAQRIRELVE